MNNLLPMFDDEVPPQAARLGPKLKALAGQGVYFGTSSWKFEGWLGSIYSPELYETRGKFSQKKFEAECLAEYAKTFPTVCGDFAFYQFPTPDYWKRLFAESPDSLSFTFKVPEEITVARWSSQPRYGTRAGHENAGFLDAEMFRSLFTRRLEPYAERVATLLIEFGTFPKSVFPTPDHFLARLDPFLAELPEGFRYAVEIRNAEYLTPAYLDVLAKHGVAHVLTEWTRMPTLHDQAQLPGTDTADFTVVRALLPRGRTYEQGGEYAPFREVKAPSESVRAAMASVADRARKAGRPAYLYVKNGLEGNSPSTIEAVADRLLA